MPSPTPTQQLVTQITSLAVSVASHISGETETKEMTKAMYKILVTGNGQPPLPETVRQHSAWIDERDAERKENKQYKKDVASDLAVLREKIEVRPLPTNGRCG